MSSNNKKHSQNNDNYDSGNLLISKTSAPPTALDNEKHDPYELRTARKAAQKKRAAKKHKQAKRDKKQAHKSGGASGFASSHRGLLAALCIVIACLIVLLIIFIPFARQKDASSSEALWMPSFSLPPPTSVASSVPEPVSEAEPEPEPSAPQTPALAFTEEELSIINTFLDEWAEQETVINVQEKDEDGEFIGDPIWEADGGHEVAVWFMDIDSGLTYERNADAAFEYASLMKAPYANYLYILVEQGNANITETFTVTEEHIQKYINNSGKIKDMELPREFTMREMIYYLIRFSDTVALKVLLERYPAAGFIEWATTLGLQHPETLGTVLSGQITARDAGILMNVLYHYMQDGHFAAELREDMENSTNRLIISPKYPTAHKYGWDTNTYHDMAAVFAPHPYVMVILTDKWGGSDKDRAGFSKFTALMEGIIEDKWAAAA